MEVRLLSVAPTSRRRSGFPGRRLLPVLAGARGACSTTTTQPTSSDGSTEVSFSTSSGTDTTSAGVYENEYFGFAIDIPQGMSSLSESELKDFASTSDLKTDANKLADGERAIVWRAADSNRAMQVLVVKVADADAVPVADYAKSRRAALEEAAKDRVDKGELDSYEVKDVQLTINNQQVPADLFITHKGSDTTCELTAYFQKGSDYAEVVSLANTEGEATALSQCIRLAKWHPQGATASARAHTHATGRTRQKRDRTQTHVGAPRIRVGPRSCAPR